MKSAAGFEASFLSLRKTTITGFIKDIWNTVHPVDHKNIFKDIKEHKLSFWLYKPY